MTSRQGERAITHLGRVWHLTFKLASGTLFDATCFTPQKPIKKAFEHKPENVKKWLEEQYPVIRERAKQEEATIYFGDEAGCRRDHQADRGYTSKEQTSLTKATGKRYTVNMISAMSNRGVFTVYVNGQRFQQRGL